MKEIYQNLDKDWFKYSLECAKHFRGEVAIDYLLGMRRMLRVRTDVTSREERIYSFLIDKMISKKNKERTIEDYSIWQTAQNVES